MTASDIERRARKHFFSNATDLEKLAEGRRNKAQNIIGVIEPFLDKKKAQAALSVGWSYCLIEEEIQRVLLPAAKFICTDLDEDALFHFEQPRLSKALVSATELDYPDESFDFIMAHQVLEHINGYEDVLKSLSRMCRPGGVIYINVPNPFSPMIGKLPDGEWPRPFVRSLLHHNTKVLKRDFLTNTERYHTGFSGRYLRRVMTGFRVYDLRQARLKQEVRHRPLEAVIDLFPTSLLFLAVETNLWCLVKDEASP